MIFNRTYNYSSALTRDEIRSRLLNQHIRVHDLDFEVSEKDKIIKVIPHAEDVKGIRTLPITHIEMYGENGGNIKIRLLTKPRKLDAGGPYMILIFCAFCIIGASLLYLLNRTGSILPSLVLMIVALTIFVLFWYRMEAGYFDYVRKIKKFVHGKIN